MMRCNPAESQIKLDVSRETMDRLQLYVQLLKKWNQKINLIAEGSIKDIWRRHIADCLQLVPIIEKHASARATICDIGSGAGLPGVVVACALTNPVILVESDLRKVAFLRQAKAELGLKNIKIMAERIENCALKVDIVTARALAPIKDLLQYSQNLMHKNAFCVFLKGENWAKEIAEAAADWQFDMAETVSLTCGQGRVVRLYNINNRL